MQWRFSAPGAISFGAVALRSLLCALLVFTSIARAAAPLDEKAIDRMIAEAGKLIGAGETQQGEQRAREALEASLANLGEDSPYTAVSLILIGFATHQLNRLDEAEAAFRRALAILRRINPDDVLGLGSILQGLANTLADAGRTSEAEAAFREALALRLKQLEPTHSDVIRSELGLGGALRKLDRLQEAEAVLRRAASDAQAAPQPDAVLVADTLEQLGLALAALDGGEEAERIYRQVLSVRERSPPGNERKLGVTLGNLGRLLWSQARNAEAEPLLTRAIAIHRLGQRPADRLMLGYTLSDLGLVLYDRNDFKPAETAHNEALQILGSLGPGAIREFGSVSVNLANSLMRQGRLKQAERLDREALRILEGTKDASDRELAHVLQSLGLIVQLKGNLAEAVVIYKRGLEKFSTARLAIDLSAADLLDGYAFATATLGNFEEGLDLIDRAMAIRAQPQNRPTIAEMKWRQGANLRIAVGDKLWARDGDAAVERVKAARQAAFADLQWARASGTGGAIAAASLRAQAGDPAVAPLARERDTLIDRIRQLDRQFLDLSADPALTDRVARLDAVSAESEAARTRLAAVDKDIATRFPAFAELSGGAPVSIAELKPLLAPDEMLVSIIPYDVTGFIFLIAGEGATSYRLPDAKDAAQQAERLRCSAARRLDPGCRTDASPGAGTGTRSAEALASDEASGLFDLGLAHQLYTELFPAEIRALMQGRKLILVPAPELIAMPWNLLVTEAPPPGWDRPGADRVALYKNAAWLFKSHPSITILPSLSSFRSLRQPAARRATGGNAFLGIGDPVIGRSDAERQAAAPACAETRMAAAGFDDFAARSASVGTGDAFSGDRDGAGFVLADVEKLRLLPRLAESRCELEAVAAALNPAEARLLVGSEASETALKALDTQGGLTRYRTIQFATHGLVSGDLGYAEPGLVLTPPGKASSADDGVLSASEIATLSLDADWVILSACSTAAGSQDGAEALTGLARAFFYAGARSLVVSSWPVYSQAAVDLTTGAFAALQADPKLSRGEALTIAMRRQLENATTEDTAHPAYWAPFFLVGAGG